jgi:hypothetical protein
MSGMRSGRRGVEKGEKETKQDRMCKWGMMDKMDDPYDGK